MMLRNKEIMKENSQNMVANTVKKLLNICKNPNPFCIANVLGITCRFVKLNDDVLAFSEKSSNKDPGTIYIHNELNEYKQKILCAHELAHLCLKGHNINQFNLFFIDEEDFNITQEYEANYFVTCLLPELFTSSNITKMTMEELNQYMSFRVEL